MKIVEFKVIGLFDLYDHLIDFNKNQLNNQGASVIMIYGRNGIGKTTILKMIDGLMTLNFDIFRTVKFKTALIKFSNKQVISVTGEYEERRLLYLNVKYNNYELKLHPTEKGAANPEDTETEINFVQQYNSDLDKFSFEFIDTERIIRRTLKDQQIKEEKTIANRKIKRYERDTETYLANKVQMFIRDSQVYHSNYFDSTEPILFDKILYNLENTLNISPNELVKKINSLSQIDKRYQIERLGLTKELWDKKKLISILNQNKNNSKESSNKLTIIASYLEVLETRCAEKKSIAERLLSFEKIINDFLLDKCITISRRGFYITSKNGDELKESQLSTGEYHLIYLTVLALCTRVKGTVIAIDEPEMSMHITWQNKLVDALTRISNKAAPQMIFATHSPDIAANFENSLVILNDGKN